MMYNITKIKQGGQNNEEKNRKHKANDRNHNSRVD